MFLRGQKRPQDLLLRLRTSTHLSSRLGDILIFWALQQVLQQFSLSVTDIIMDSELESYAYKTTMQLAQVKIFLLRDTFEELTVTKIH